MKKQLSFTFLVLSSFYLNAMKTLQIDYAVEQKIVNGDPEIAFDLNATEEELQVYGPRGPLLQFTTSQPLSGLEAVGMGVIMQNMIANRVKITNDGPCENVQGILAGLVVTDAPKEGLEELEVASLGTAFLTQDVFGHFLVSPDKKRYQAAHYSWEQVLGLMLMGMHLPSSRNIADGTMPHIYAAKQLESTPILELSEKKSDELVLTWKLTQ